MSLQLLRILDFSPFIKFREKCLAVCSILVDLLGFTKKFNYKGISWESQIRIVKKSEGLKGSPIVLSIVTLTNTCLLHE
jgi:hypothetical protein